MPYADTWENDLEKVIKLVRTAYPTFPQTVLTWETWVSKAPKRASDCPPYIPFAKELFGLDNFSNGKDLSYLGADGVTVKNNVPDVNAFGFDIGDMAHYETAPSMIFGKHSNILTSSVPYKQVDSNGNPIFIANDLNEIQNQKKKVKVLSKKRKCDHQQEIDQESVADEDGYTQLTILGRHKIPKFGDPVGNNNNSTLYLS